MSQSMMHYDRGGGMIMMYDNDRGGGLKDLEIMVEFKIGIDFTIPNG